MAAYDPKRTFGLKTNSRELACVFDWIYRIPVYLYYNRLFFDKKY